MNHALIRLFVVLFIAFFAMSVSAKQLTQEQQTELAYKHTTIDKQGVLTYMPSKLRLPAGSDGYQRKSQITFFKESGDDVSFQYLRDGSDYVTIYQTKLVPNAGEDFFRYAVGSINKRYTTLKVITGAAIELPVFNGRIYSYAGSIESGDKVYITALLVNEATGGWMTKIRYTYLLSGDLLDAYKAGVNLTLPLNSEDSKATSPAYLEPVKVLINDISWP